MSCTVLELYRSNLRNVCTHAELNHLPKEMMHLLLNANVYLNVVITRFTGALSPTTQFSVYNPEDRLLNQSLVFNGTL